jgi:prefoldin subunit 5
MVIASKLRAFWNIPETLERLIRHLNCLEAQIMTVRDEFNSELAELGFAITDLASRIDQIPDAEDITQDDIDALKASVNRINDLAVQSPQIPTDGGTDTGDTSGDSTGDGTETPTDGQTA